jgi:hypothetical protein
MHRLVASRRPASARPDLAAVIDAANHYPGRGLLLKVAFQTKIGVAGCQ